MDLKKTTFNYSSTLLSCEPLSS